MIRTAAQCSDHNHDFMAVAMAATTFNRFSAPPAHTQESSLSYDTNCNITSRTTPALLANTLIPQTDYLWRDDTLTGVVVHQPTRQVAVILTDHLGSPIEVHDMTGALLWTWYADAFGTTLPDEDPGHTGKRFTLNIRFPGQYHDAESGLHYNGQRYYAPTLGRYVSSDPIGLVGGANTFAYVGGNPVGNFDADGLQVAIPPQLIIPGVPNPTAEAQKQLAERISEAFRRNSRTKTYQTYTRFNPRTGQCYTGRTSGYDDPETNVRNRGYGQAALNAEGFRPGVLDKSSENYAPIRGREQQVLEINGGAQSSGGTSRNKINGISPINPAGPYVYLPAALEEFGEPKPAALCTCK